MSEPSLEQRFSHTDVDSISAFVQWSNKVAFALIPFCPPAAGNHVLSVHRAGLLLFSV